MSWIRVNLAGGWSKRSRGYNYNAASGATIIIGNTIGKILFLGVRNKFCSICARAANKNDTPVEHNHFRNWSRSSSAMEAHIIIEGFNLSEKMHGLRYLEFIGDGDSSVFFQDQRKYQLWKICQ